MRNRIIGAVAGATTLGVAALAVAQIPSGVPTANPRAGAPLTKVADGYMQIPLAQGNDPLENPVGIFKRYGYLDDMLPISQGGSGEPTGTEADINTYLVKEDIGGPTDGYDYGSHFLFQGHENGRNNKGQDAAQAYVTRINLDVKDPAHRITLITPPDADNNTGFTRIDGSTYDPFTGEMLFTQEGNGTATGGVIGVPVQWSDTTPPPSKTYYGSIGHGGFEGIHPDGSGNLIMAEDIGGSGITDPDPAQNGNKKPRQPNSFIYRFLPKSGGDLSEGKLQALQVTVNGTVKSFHGTGGCADGSSLTAVDDTYGADMKALHSGSSHDVKWVTVHDTDVDGTAVFNANAAAKAACATPFKRPETLQFVPGTKFASIVFDETGDTDKAAGDDPNAAGAWGAILRVDFPSAGASTGKIKTILNGDGTLASFDNISFLDGNTLLMAEDRGETLHQQMNALDSLWSVDLTKPIDQINADAKRLVAEGRDSSANANAGHISPDSVPTSPSTFQNDGDNEVTGVHVSDGNATRQGVLGKMPPSRGSRMFYTAQHGENITYEIKPVR